MLTASGWVLAATTLAGILLFAFAQWSRPAGRVWLPGAAHGTLGISGAGLLVAGLRGPPRGAETGAGSFGLIAAIMVGLALVAGFVLFAARLRRRRPSALVIGVHATLAVFGLVMLVAYISAPA